MIPLCVSVFVSYMFVPGMTGILMCAAGLPVCLTRAPKPILHPPPINKSDMKPVPGVNGMRRKTKKKHLRRGKTEAPLPAQTSCSRHTDVCIRFLSIHARVKPAFITRDQASGGEPIGSVRSRSRMMSLACVPVIQRNSADCSARL